MEVSDHLKIAESLSELCEQNVLIVGSGFATHKGGKPGAPPPAWATAFKQWLNETLTCDSLSPDERKMKILSSAKTAPNINIAHPRLEHFLPLIMCSAIAKYQSAKLIHSEFLMESLLNEHYLF
jgi:aromatic ring-opening dioxygenase catalytic subunit (LigB family)